MVLVIFLFSYVVHLIQFNNHILYILCIQYIHSQSDINAHGFRELNVGNNYKFEIVMQDDGRRKAVKVTLYKSGGKNIRGGYSSRT